MNKKGMEININMIIILLVRVEVIGVIGTLVYNISKSNSSATNKAIVKTWVNEKLISHAGPLEYVPGELGTERPPIPELDEPYIIDSVSKLEWKGSKPPEAFFEIANSMFDCWDAFERGKKDFLVERERDAFCYPCRQIVFDENVREKYASVKGFQKFLNDYGPRGSDDSVKYMQVLTNNPSFVQEDFSDDEFVVQDNLYIFFTAFSGRRWTQIAAAVTGFKDNAPSSETAGELEKPIEKAGKYIIKRQVAQGAGQTFLESFYGINLNSGALAAFTKLIGPKVAAIGFKVVPVVGWGVTIVSAGVGTYNVLFGDIPFVAHVDIVDAEQVNKLCNEELDVREVLGKEALVS